MFGGKEKTQSNKAAATATALNGLNSLVKGTEIEGKVSAKSDIRVDGTIKGSLECEAKVIIGPTGYIEGQINCANAMIEGRFEGTLNVKGLLNVRKTASINGEITTAKLIVEAGAVFNVSCHMGGVKKATNARQISGKDKKAAKLTKEAS
jgi:cytoskeletal protein CcmA (bactofilin family)